MPPDAWTLKRRRRIVKLGAAALILCALVPPWREPETDGEFLGWSPLSHPGRAGFSRAPAKVSGTAASPNSSNRYEAFEARTDGTRENGPPTGARMRFHLGEESYARVAVAVLALEVFIVAVFCSGAWMLAGMRPPDSGRE